MIILENAVECYKWILSGDYWSNWFLYSERKRLLSARKAVGYIGEVKRSSTNT